MMEEHRFLAVYVVGYFCLQWTAHFLCGKEMHRGLSKGCLYVSSLHQGCLLPLLTAVSIYRTLDAKGSFPNWLATPSASLLEAERHPAYAMVAYLLSDLTDFRSPAFSCGLIAHHLITMFAVYTMTAWLPAYSNLAFLGMVTPPPSPSPLPPHPPPPCSLSPLCPSFEAPFRCSSSFSWFPLSLSSPIIRPSSISFCSAGPPLLSPSPPLPLVFRCLL